ncbi:MAG: CDP-glycerol--poly(glycerophosphate) glycerophosphotransferase [Gammaproteobacteria bacterium]|nr:CDP-glycerol--poly(glycerophosphate) glycerophosphotransferase [Gammaproteobacteria bacterium]
MKPQIFFDVPHLYYLPQFLPIYRELTHHDVDVKFTIYTDIDGKAMTEVLKNVVKKEQLPVHWVSTLQDGRRLYEQHQPTWIIFGNTYKYLDDLPASIKTAMVNHGAGIKSAGHNINACRFDIRFAEGTYQLEQLKKHYPPGNYIDVGFSKLDPIFNADIMTPALDLKTLGLDINKPTLLYAPTFYPSSIALFSDNWPQQFSDFNLIVKPHFFTITKKTYHQQRRKLARWKTAPNVYVADSSEYSLLPFFATADLLISDASTALFEFAALNKPVVWCDFLKLRWTYRGPLAFRYKKRMDQDILRYADIAVHASHYNRLLDIVKQQIDDPGEFETQRKAYAERLLGRLDGKVSERIIKALLGTQI